MYFHELEQMNELRTDVVRVAPAVGCSEVGLRADYGAAMRRPYEDMPLSRRGEAGYANMRKQRRADLEAILRRGICDENRKNALDLICAICEESSWAQEAEEWEDASHPSIDFFAAETACLLAWTSRELRHVRASGRILYELRRRVFTPFIAHDDYPVLHPEATLALASVCEIAIANLLTETDNSRRFTLLKRAARTADLMTEAARPAPLMNLLTDRVAAVTLWEVYSRMSGRPRSQSFPPYQWLDEVFLSRISGTLFLDPAGTGMTGRINGADIFFLGRLSGDDALEALGATLYQKHACSPSVLSARLMADFSQEMLKSAAVPRLKHGSLSDHSLMLARGGSLMAHLTAGGQGNAGDLCVCCEDRPVLISLIGDAPVLNSLAQRKIPGAGDCEISADRADLSMDVTHCYSPESGVRFAQRTAMVDRTAGVIRVIDMVESRVEGTIRYAFVTPERPAEIEGGVRLGNAVLRWEGEKCRVTDAPPHDAFPGGLYRIDLTFPLNPGSNMTQFVVEKA